VERYIAQVAQLLRKDGWGLYALFERKSEKEDGLIDQFDQVFYDDPRSRNNLYTMLKEVSIQCAFVHKVSDPSLLKSLRQHFKMISVIHDHDYYCLRKHKYYPIGRINCKRPFRRLFCTACSLGIERKSGGMIPFRFLDIDAKQELLKEIKKADVSIVLSEYMKSNLIRNGWDAEKIHKIYPIQKLYDPPMKKKSESIKLLYVGQLIRGKGVDLLLDALRYIKMPYKADIIGTGNDEMFIRNLIIKYGLHEKVNLIGWANDVVPFYQNADIVIVPSRWQEPFGLIGVESFAHGKPVVAFHVGGIGEWLQDGVNGYLVPENQPKLMAKKIQELMTDFNKMLKFGENGYKMVAEDYTTQCFMSRFKTVFNLLEESHKK